MSKKDKSGWNTIQHHQPTFTMTTTLKNSGDSTLQQDETRTESQMQKKPKNKTSSTKTTSKTQSTYISKYTNCRIVLNALDLLMFHDAIRFSRTPCTLHHHSLSHNNCINLSFDSITVSSPKNTALLTPLAVREGER